MKFKTVVICLSLMVGAQIQAQNYNFEWVTPAYSTSTARGWVTTTDLNGNVYTGGIFNGRVDLDSGAGVTQLTSKQFVGTDAYVKKLDANGNLLWVYQYGSLGSEFIRAIEVDNSNNVYILGAFGGSMDIDPGPDTLEIVPFQGMDIFLQKLDSNGKLMWAKSIGGTSNDLGSSLALDNKGHLYLAGGFQGSFIEGDSTLNSAGNFDVFIEKLDTAGNVIWIKQMGAVRKEVIRSIEVDGSGNIYAIGEFQGSFDVDPGAGINTLVSKGNNNSLILKMDSNGSHVWAKSLSSSNANTVSSINLDNNGDLVALMNHTGTVTIDTGTSSISINSKGQMDVYILKLDTNGNTKWMKQIGGSDTELGRSAVTDINANIYLTGQFKGEVDFNPGMDTNTLTSAGDNDVFLQKLNLNGEYIWATRLGGKMNVNPYDFYLDADRNIIVTGSYNDTLDFNSVGDATFITNDEGTYDEFTLKLSPCSVNGVDSVVACRSYTWIDGKTYTESIDSVSYTILDGSSDGCDSVVTLKLTINQVSDVGTTRDGGIFTANNALAAYLWLDCSNNYAAISGETTQSFTPTTNGSYAVQLTENGCTDTSACVDINNVGVERSVTDEFKVYPNPSSGWVKVDFSQQLDEVQVSIYSATGALIKRIQSEKMDHLDLTLDVKPGMYFIDVQSPVISQVIKIVIQ